MTTSEQPHPLPHDHSARFNHRAVYFLLPTALVCLAFLLLLLRYTSAQAQAVDPLVQPAQIDALDAPQATDAARYFVYQTNLTPTLPDLATNLFGYTTQLDGNTALVNDNKSVYTFVRDGSSWNQQTKLTLAIPGIDPADLSIISAALSGDTLVLQWRSCSPGCTPNTRIYVYIRNGATWGFQAELRPDTPSETLLANPVIRGDTILAHAVVDGDGGFHWQIYAFVRNGAVWSKQAILTPAGGSADLGRVSSLAMSGNTAVVGVPERGAYVFVRNGTTWSQQAKLVGSGSRAIEEFAVSVAINFNTIAVGGPAEFHTQSVFIFVRDGITWTQQARVVAADGIRNGFGSGVAINGNTLVTSAPDDDWFGPGLGAAYVFARSNGVWTQQQKILAATVNVDRFARSVSINPDTILVSGLPYAGSTGKPGQVQVFAASASDPTPPIIATKLNGVSLSGTSKWLNIDATLEWQVLETESMVTSQTGCTTTVINQSSTGTVVTCAASSAGGSTSKSVTVRVDKENPLCTVTAKPKTLFPANHGMKTVTNTLALTDTLSGILGFTLASVVSSEPDNGVTSGDLPGDIAGWKIGTPDISGRLRAERADFGGGACLHHPLRGKGCGRQHRQLSGRSAGADQFAKRRGG